MPIAVNIIGSFSDLCTLLNYCPNPPFSSSAGLGKCSERAFYYLCIHLLDEDCIHKTIIYKIPSFGSVTPPLNPHVRLLDVRSVCRVLVFS